MARDGPEIASQCFLRNITRSVMATMEVTKLFLGHPQGT